MLVLLVIETIQQYYTYIMKDRKKQKPEIEETDNALTKRKG